MFSNYVHNPTSLIFLDHESYNNIANVQVTFLCLPLSM